MAFIMHLRFFKIHQIKLGLACYFVMNQKDSFALENMYVALVIEMDLRVALKRINSCDFLQRSLTWYPKLKVGVERGIKGEHLSRSFTIFVVRKGAS